MMFVSLLENHPVFADLATAVLTPIEQGAAAGVLMVSIA
jgi:hypothetical protein